MNPSSLIESAIQSVFWYSNGAEPWISLEEREQRIADLRAEEVAYETADGLRLTGLWVPASGESRKTALIFHGTDECLLENTELAAWYRERGYQVLLASYRGYPGQPGNSRVDGEKGVIYDVDAALRFLIEDKDVTPSRIRAHGISLGGAYAGIAGAKYGTHVTLDHCFTSAADVVEAVVSKYTLGFVSTWARGKVDAVLPASGQRISGHLSIIEIDGLNTLQKVSRLAGDLCVVYGLKDEFMPVDFATRLYQARYCDREAGSGLIAMTGGHIQTVLAEEAARDAYAFHLRDLEA